MDQAFRAARKAEPSGKVKLFYNECKQPNAPAVALSLALPGSFGFRDRATGVLLRFECGPGTFRVKAKLELGWWAIGKDLTVVARAQTAPRA